MAEVIVGILSVLGGGYYTVRGLLRIWSEREAAIKLKLPSNGPERTLITEKLIQILLILAGLILIGVSVVLVLVTQTPRPDIVRGFITWSVVAMPAILGILAFNSEKGYEKEVEALRVAGVIPGPVDGVPEAN